MDSGAVLRGEVQAILLSHPDVETSALATRPIGRSLHLYAWLDPFVTGVFADSFIQ